MKMYVYKHRDFIKESCEVQKAITGAVANLYKRIKNYEAQNISFEKIVNDDHVKYDQYGKFYAYKIKKPNMQLRILYSYIVIDGTPIVLVGDFFIKKKNNKKYISEFDCIAKTLDPYTIYKSSECVANF